MILDHKDQFGYLLYPPFDRVWSVNYDYKGDDLGSRRSVWLPPLSSLWSSVISSIMNKGDDHTVDHEDQFGYLLYPILPKIGCDQFNYDYKGNDQTPRGSVWLPPLPSFWSGVISSTMTIRTMILDHENQFGYLLYPPIDRVWSAPLWL